MMSLIGIMIGFVSSVVPEFFRYFKDQKDKAHALSLLDRQCEYTKLLGAQRLEEVKITADSQEMVALYQHARATGSKWVDAFAGTVRPALTYAFFLLYGAVKSAQFLLLWEHFHSWPDALFRLWSEEDEALFAAVISFWFGQRTFKRVSK